MTDAEIRGRLLAHFHALRHNNGGWIPIDPIILAPEPVTLQVIGGVCQQLADIGLIQWKPLQSSNGLVAGMAKITGQGVAAVESGHSASIDIRFPSKNETAPSVPSRMVNPLERQEQTSDDELQSEALVAIREAVWEIKVQLPTLIMSNAATSEIQADIIQITAETERPSPRRRFMKIYLESLRDDLAKAAGSGTAAGIVALVTLVGGLLAKFFGVF
jgi:hypothetical protein